MNVVRAIGVDPGARSGALVLLKVRGETPSALWWASWLQLQRKGGAVWRLSVQAWNGAVEAIEHSRSPALFEDLATRLSGWDRALGASSVASVACEGLFFDTRNRNGARELHLRTGDLMGCLSRAGYAPDLQPPASAWRPAVLGIAPMTAAAEAEAAAVAWAAEHVWPEGLAERTEVEVGALSEAACIAMHGLRMQLRRAA